MHTTEQTTHDRILADRARYVAPASPPPSSSSTAPTGRRVTDVDGRTFLDFAGGSAARTPATALRRSSTAIHAQADRFLHQCFMVGTYEPYVEVCRRLAELSPCARRAAKSILVNSGAEAVENAVKIARVATGRPAVVVFDNAFHGRTLLTMTMTRR